MFEKSIDKRKYVRYNSDISNKQTFDYLLTTEMQSGVSGGVGARRRVY